MLADEVRRWLGSRRPDSRARRSVPRASRPPADSDRPSRRRCDERARPALRPGSAWLRGQCSRMLGDRARVAVVDGDEVVAAEEEVDVVRREALSSPLRESRCRAARRRDSRRTARSWDTAARSSRPRPTADESRTCRTGSATRESTARPGRPRARRRTPDSARRDRCSVTCSVRPFAVDENRRSIARP